MYTNMGLLIAIEGIDGAGKTTQVGRLRRALSGVGLTLRVSKEPTSGRWGQIIRDSASQGRLTVDEELDLLIKDRAEHVETLIAPALARGETVILDRYFYSTIAYQGSRGMDTDAIKASMEQRFPIPDATFILDLDPIISVHRIAHSRHEAPNHFEDRQNLANARAIFRQIKHPNVHEINGELSEEEVFQQILARFIEGALKAKFCGKSYGCDDYFHCSDQIQGKCPWIQLRSQLLTQNPTATHV